MFSSVVFVFLVLATASSSAASIPDSSSPPPYVNPLYPSPPELEGCHTQYDCPRYTGCPVKGGDCRKSEVYLAPCDLYAAEDNCTQGFYCRYYGFSEGTFHACYPELHSTSVDAGAPCLSDFDCGFDVANDEWARCDEEEGRCPLWCTGRYDCARYTWCPARFMGFGARTECKRSEEYLSACDYSNDDCVAEGFSCVWTTFSDGTFSACQPDLLSSEVEPSAPCQSDLDCGYDVLLQDWIECNDEGRCSNN